MRIRVLLFVLVVSLGSVVQKGPAGAEEAPAEPDQVTSAQKARGTAVDPNAPAVDLKNKPGVKMAAPPDKGGPAERGARACRLRVDNRTDLIIQIFVNDGRYTGVVGPYGDSYGWIETPSMKLYARADFTDGSSTSWGPVQAPCHGSFWWRIN